MGTLLGEPEVTDASSTADPLGVDLSIGASLAWPSGAAGTTALELDLGDVPRVRTVAGLETYDHQLGAVVDALASGEPLPTEGDDPIANMRLIEAGRAEAGVPRP